MNIPTIIEGNTFALAIPLQVYAIKDDELILHDYVPESGDNVTIGLKGARRNYSYTPTFSNNIAFVALGGNELCGIYAVEVAIVKDDGTKLTSFKGQQLKIVKSIDELTTTEIVDGVSQNVLYLDPEIFIAGKDGRGIVSIVKISTSGLVDTYTINYTDNTTSTFNVTNGAQGDDGVGITSIEKTSTAGLVDTYTITLSNGNTSTFEVTNGKDGEGAQPPYIVNLTWDNSAQKYTADKTPEDCQNAYEAGQIVIFRDRGTYQSVNTFEWLMSTSQYYPQPNLRIIFAYRIEGKDNDGNLRISQLLYRSQIVTTLTVNTITAQQLLESGVNIKTINSTSLLGGGNISVLSQEALTNFCPIIEDTRSSAVATITGVAPFSTLVDGQRIMLKVAQYIPNSPTLTLTLSGGSATSAIPMYTNYQSTPLSSLWSNSIRNGSYIELVYESTDNRWVMVGQKDSNTTYQGMNQNWINIGSSTGSNTISPKLIHDNAYIVEETYSSGSLKANKFYDFGTVSSALTIPSLDATNDLVSNALNFYALRFIAGADNISITFPTGVLVDDTPTINTGDYVEIMINKYGSNFYASIKVWQAQ